MKKISSKLKLLANSISLSRLSGSADSYQKEEEEKQEGSIDDNIDIFEDNFTKVDVLQRVDSNGCLLRSSQNEKLSMPLSESLTTRNYALLEKLGEGAHGKVYKSIDLKTKKTYAIKISKLTDENRKYLKNELNVMKKLISPHIVAVHEGFTVANKLWLVMEHCVGGSILDVMKVKKLDSLSEPLLKRVMASLLVALNFLHENRIIHRDIKASNLVLTDGGSIKLIDFGVSAELEEGENFVNTVIGSPYWMAPEVIEGKKYDQKADMWSLGMTLLELFDRQHPLFRVHPVSVLFKIVTADPPCLRPSAHSEYSSEIYDFFAKCMQKDPAQRAGSKELLNHSWVQQTVGDIVFGDASCVNDLEQLFLDYVFDDDIDVLPWDEEDDDDDDHDDDELDVTQIQFADLPASEFNEVVAGVDQVIPLAPTSRQSMDKCLEAGGDDFECPAESLVCRQEIVRIANEEAALETSKESTSTDEFSHAIKSSRYLTKKKVSFASESFESPDSWCDAQNEEKESPYGLKRQVSFASEVSENEVLRIRKPTTSNNVSIYSHPSARNCEVPSLKDIPISLRHPSSQNFIQRVLHETHADDGYSSCSTTYRSLCSFEDALSLDSISVNSSRGGTAKKRVNVKRISRQQTVSSVCSSLSDSSGL